MPDKPCDRPPCNVKKGAAGGEVDLGQLAEKKNRNTVYKIIAGLAIVIITIWFIFAPPGGAPLIGEPIEPVSGSIAIIAGMILGMVLMLFIGIVWVVKRKKK